MDIRILQLKEGARQAKGLTVIIDVFRAFTTEAWCFQRGAEKVIPVADIEAAFAYKKAHPDAVLCGERGGKMIEGFDFGNSPSQVEQADLTGKTVVHTTSAGTQGIDAAKAATEILGGSLVSARAIAAYIRRKNPETVSLVCMGLAGETRTDEDTLCARYIKQLLLGSPPAALKHLIARLKYTDGAKFLDPRQQDVFPRRDFELSTDADSCNFILRLNRDAELPYMERVEVSGIGTPLPAANVRKGDRMSQFEPAEASAFPADIKRKLVYSGYTEPQGNFDAALVLGGNPDVMKCRAQAAAKLYKQGRCKLFLPTGGVAWETEFGFLSESQVLTRYLLDLGVPQSAVWAEDAATTTGENMRCCKMLIAGRMDLTKARIAVVTSRFHLRRSVALAQHYIPEATHVGVAAVQEYDNAEQFTENETVFLRVTTECRLLCELVRNGTVADFPVL